MSQLNSSVTHSQEIMLEYKSQLERSRAQCQEMNKEMRLREQEIDQLKRENMLEAEKVQVD